MNLNFTIKFNDLNSQEGLKKIDQTFLHYLKDRNKLLYDKLLFDREEQNIDTNFLIEVSHHLDDFVSKLFFIETENFYLKKNAQEFDIIYECRRKFVQRVVKHKSNISEAENKIWGKIEAKKLEEFIGRITEHSFAHNVMKWLIQPEKFVPELEIAAYYSQYMVENNSNLPLFNIPRNIDEDNLIRAHRIEMLTRDNYIGFDYRDREASMENALSHAKYCIYCHNQKKDSCRTGLKASVDKEKKGCPLDQKISEMNKLFSNGFNIGALAMTIIDNPIVAATGHRICNDCMKSCIFQKQEPVNVPLIESRILENVLRLPYGVEIYLLLTRWNPLNIMEPLPQQLTNYNVLVVGLGPAGFALSHYLLNQGHNITAIDGLKINPLNFDITKPIKNWQKIKVALSERLPQGFGGVAEYGITHRWDKNNLILIRLILERRKNFQMFGGIKFGDSLTVTQALEFGFDHIALCLGAGKPRYMNDSSYFFKGVKSAADFLMNLQQGGSYLSQSNSKLQIRMPAVVIGCGLTAIDSAVEIINYYPRQVEKFLINVKKGLVDLASLSLENKVIAREFIAHAKLFRQAKSDIEKIKIINKLGGVKICYRGKIKQSPAYLRNHEEIEQAIALGVDFIENISPLKVIANKYDYAEKIQFQDINGIVKNIKARTILIAIGTEDVKTEFKNQHLFSRFGDYNPVYSGSVVKALASAKDGYKNITNILEKVPPKSNSNKLNEILNKNLIAKVYSLKELSPKILELVIKAPLLAQNYRPGQVFRLQNYAFSDQETMKQVALRPFEVDNRNGLIYFLISIVGNSTKLCSKLKENDEVVLMGPVGKPTNIFLAEKILLIGYGIQNMALLPIAKAFKEKGTKVVFWANYQKARDLIYQNKIEAVSDQVIWGDAKFEKWQNLQPSILDLIEPNPDCLPIISYVPIKILSKIKNLFKSYKVTANLLAPMQCMMQGICGQCLVKVKDKGYVFACQDTEYILDKFEPKVLTNRVKQNSL